MSPEDPAGPRPRASVRPASVDELPMVLAILSAATERMIAEGDPHPWPRPFPADRVLASLSQGVAYLVETPPDLVIGTITLLWDDPTFWGEQPPNAGYVHRLAIHPRFAGAGWGREILDWAAARVRDRGRRYLRLDCARSSTRLRQHYAQLGFREVGDRSGPPLPFPVTLFERDVE